MKWRRRRQREHVCRWSILPAFRMSLVITHVNTHRSPCWRPTPSCRSIIPAAMAVSRHGGDWHHVPVHAAVSARLHAWVGAHAPDDSCLRSVKCRQRLATVSHDKKDKYYDEEKNSHRPARRSFAIRASPQEVHTTLRKAHRSLNHITFTGNRGHDDTAMHRSRMPRGLRRSEHKHIKRMEVGA